MRAIILNFHRETHVSPIQNESYWQSPVKTKSNVECKKRDNLSLLSSFTKAIELYTWARNIYLQDLLAKHSDMGRILNGFIPFSQMENVFPIHWWILKVLENKTSQSFMLGLKCDHSFFKWISHLIFNS